MKSKKPVNIDGISLEESIPQVVKKIFIEIAKNHQDYIGTKLIDHGFIVKETNNKCTISLQIQQKLYTAKLKFIISTNKWDIDGEIDHWENVEYLLF